MSTLLVPISKALIRFCVNHSDLVIFPCDFYRRIFEQRFGKASKSVIWPSPIVLPEPNPCIRSIADINVLADKPLPLDCKLLTYVGRIGSEKGIADLIDLFAKLHAVSEFPLGLVLIGPGEIDLYRAYADSKGNGVGNCIAFLGLQSHSNVMAVNKLSWAAVTASPTEVQGLALIEQSAYALPVVVPRGTCWEEMILKTDCGIFSDEAPLCILRFLECEGMTAGTKGQLYVNHILSPELLFDQLIQTYRKLLFSSQS